jgi:hypothetical protein
VLGLSLDINACTREQAWLAVLDAVARPGHCRLIAISEEDGEDDRTKSNIVLFM